jgi:acetyl esterase/lipase
MPSAEMELIRELVAVTSPHRHGSLAERRARYDLAETAFTDDVPQPARPVRVAGCPAEWVGNREDAGTVVLYLHGGSYSFGSPRSHRHLAGAIAAAAGAAALVLDYPLAPEHPFPAAVEATVEAYRWLLATGSAPARVVLAGDSAGAGLVLAALLTVRGAGEPLPAAGVCLSPWVDLTCTGESHAGRAGRDPLLDTADLLRMADGYLAGADPRDPLVSPVFADLRGLPPLLIQAGTEEVLLSEARLLADRARGSGVAVTYQEWPDMIHVWQYYFPVLAEGREAVTAIGEFVRAAVDLPVAAG